MESSFPAKSHKMQHARKRMEAGCGLARLQIRVPAILRRLPTRNRFLSGTEAEAPQSRISKS
ncbi:hypothetical protein RGR602_PC00906 (plasmid) [Rhizobium gallicum bv. gallicum R602sp]|uniref:Uncharacterized protein n=1 Tax=Rhizobium gallicum bv. gallicum R602sp TaxID=1041138 RepID=A0A0B4XAF3_9HYPH|nr:hypothetical protein RGR602_PC00906 [Rhizobium gallicum bv. gallicum R602sp]